MQDYPTARAFGRVIERFQDAIAVAYDAIKNGPKPRRNLSSEAQSNTEMRVAYTFPGSFGVVFTIPNDKITIPGVAPSLERATQTVFRVAKANKDTEMVLEVAREVGKGPIAAIYDWAKVSAQNELVP